MAKSLNCAAPVRAVRKLTALLTRWDGTTNDYAIAAMVPLRNYAFGAMFVTLSDGKKRVVNVFVNDKEEVVFWDSKNPNSIRVAL